MPYFCQRRALIFKNSETEVVCQDNAIIVCFKHNNDFVQYPISITKTFLIECLKIFFM